MIHSVSAGFLAARLQTPSSESHQQLLNLSVLALSIFICCQNMVKYQQSRIRLKNVSVRIPLCLSVFTYINVKIAEFGYNQLFQTIVATRPNYHQRSSITRWSLFMYLFFLLQRIIDCMLNLDFLPMIFFNSLTFPDNWLTFYFKFYF